MIVLYTKKNCSHCMSAKMKLEQIGVSYKNFEVGIDISREYIVENFPLAKSYPIVVVNGSYIGGHAELENYLNENNDHSGKQFLTEG